MDFVGGVHLNTAPTTINTRLGSLMIHSAGSEDTFCFGRIWKVGTENICESAQG